MTQHRSAAVREPSVAELAENARYTADRAARYRRKVYLGRGEPVRLAELERIADGAATRLGTARASLTNRETP